LIISQDKLFVYVKEYKVETIIPHRQYKLVITSKDKESALKYGGQACS